MSNDTAFLIEYMDDKFAAILEYLAPFQPLPAKVEQIDKRLRDVETDVKVIKAVVTDQSGNLIDHAKRITKLERRAA